MFWRGRCECVSVDVSVSVVEDWRRGGGEGKEVVLALDCYDGFLGCVL